MRSLVHLRRKRSVESSDGFSRSISRKRAYVRKAADVDQLGNVIIRVPSRPGRSREYEFCRKRLAANLRASRAARRSSSEGWHGPCVSAVPGFSCGMLGARRRRRKVQSTARRRRDERRRRSAVAAGLLTEAGHEVVGLPHERYAPKRPAHAKSCCGAEDFDDARRSAAVLDIPHYVLDEEAFRRRRHRPLRERVCRGRTPNPCVVATKSSNWVHLRALADRKLGASSYVATGHYARGGAATKTGALFAGRRQQRTSRMRSRNSRRGQLEILLLPLGTSTKDETRAQAAPFRLAGPRQSPIPKRSVSSKARITGRICPGMASTATAAPS